MVYSLYDQGIRLVGLRWVSKVNLSRYTPWRRLGGEEVKLLFILKLGTRWGEWSVFCPWPRFTPGRDPRYPLHRRLCGTTAGLDTGAYTTKIHSQGPRSLGRVRIGHHKGGELLYLLSNRLLLMKNCQLSCRRTLRFNTANTKFRQRTRSWASFIHRPSS
jgi:hypothetical protein